MINFLAITSLCIASSILFAAENTPEFTQQVSRSTNGAIELQWRDVGLNDGEYYEVHEFEHSSNQSLGVKYQGTLSSAFMSGLENGAYYFKVRVNGREGSTTDWSEATQVVVAHYSLQFAFLLFGIGAFVFLAIIFVILRGERND